MPGEWPVSPAFMRMQSSTAILRQSKRSRSNGVSLGAKKQAPIPSLTCALNMENDPQKSAAELTSRNCLSNAKHRKAG